MYVSNPQFQLEFEHNGIKNKVFLVGRGVVIAMVTTHAHLDTLLVLSFFNC